MITLSANSVTLSLDPDLYWQDEFDWTEIEEAEDRSISGARIIDIGIKSGGRPITLTPADDDSGWMLRATLTQLQAWEKIPGLIMTLNLRGVSYQVNFRRTSGAPIESRPVIFVSNPLPGEFGDWYLTTLRFCEV